MVEVKEVVGVYGMARARGWWPRGTGVSRGDHLTQVFVFAVSNWSHKNRFHCILI